MVGAYLSSAMFSIPVFTSTINIFDKTTSISWPIYFGTIRLTKNPVGIGRTLSPFKKPFHLWRPGIRIQISQTNPETFINFIGIITLPIRQLRTKPLKYSDEIDFTSYELEAKENNTIKIGISRQNNIAIPFKLVN